MKWIRLALLPTTVILLLAVSLVVFCAPVEAYMLKFTLADLTTGAIYITGNTMGFVYPNDVGKPADVHGIVKTKNGVPYIEFIQAGLANPLRNF